MTSDLPKMPSPADAVSEEALQWIVRLNSGTAKAADRRAFLAWRATSEEHERAAIEAEALWMDAGELHLDRSTGAVRPGPRGSGTTRRKLLAVSAGALAAGGLLGRGLLGGWTSDYETGTGETRTVTLPDGSRVTLNARSAMDLLFSAAERRVALLGGEAFFEVKSDRARPFRVQARNVVVTALGTAFDVDANLADEAVAVSVADHSVEVVAAKEQPMAGRLRLSKDQAIVCDAAGHFGPVEPSDPSVASWRTGMYVAENRTLGDVVAALRSYHPGWIVIRGGDTAKLRVNAVLNLRTPDASLDSLAGGLPVTVRRLSPYLVVIASA